MILTASDVVTISKSLHRWEIAEYCFTALVTIACAGEYVAEFTNWFTGGIKERKEALIKRSTLLLVASLALELTCLVQTNNLSGLLIGSLSDKAENADRKAQSAIDKSSLAESKADAANLVSGNAQLKAGAASELADKTAKDAAYLASIVSGRNIADIEGLVAKWRRFKGLPVVFESPTNDPEASGLCSGLLSAAWSAGMSFTDRCGTALITGQVVNIWVYGPDDGTALSVSKDISNIGKLTSFVGGPFEKSSELTVFIGQKPSTRIFGLFKPPKKPLTKKTQAQ